MREKILAQIQGIGVGYLPIVHVYPEIKSGRLIPKKIEKGAGKSFISYSWNIDKQEGKAMQWLLNYLELYGTNLLISN